MPSPFPGMDPFLENQEWEDFHSRWNTALAEALMPRARPKYYVRVERRVECVIPMPQERRETYLVIRERETHEVFTVIETLSPSNKRPRSDGRREYLEKREAILASPAHLVELDLLRGGARLPMDDRPPAGDYYAIVSRRPRRPVAHVYAWLLAHPLPVVAIPLLAQDPDVSLDLQQVFATVYDRAGYDLSLNYDAPFAPPLNTEEHAWIQGLRNPGD